MQKRIRYSAIITTLLSLLFFMFVCLLWVNESFTTIIRNDMDSLLKTTISLSGDQAVDMDQFARDLSSNLNKGARVTVIDTKGQILGDSHSDFTQMQSHSSRPEVIDALETGYGEDLRKSETRGINTLYMARSWGEDYILRLAIPFTPVPDFLKNVLPAFAVSFFIAVILMFFVSKRTTQRITEDFKQFTKNISHAVEKGISGDNGLLPEIQVFDEFAPIIRNFEQLFDNLYSTIGLMNEKQEEVEKIIGAMEEGLLLLDNEFNILLANDQGIQAFYLTGLSSEKNITHLYRNEAFIDLLKEIKETEKSSAMDITKNDHSIHRIHISPVKKEGFVILTTDITKMKQLENIRSEFSANVSHELKTPITTISGFAELLYTGMVTDSDKIKDYSLKIYKESKRLIELIDDILKLSQIEQSPVFSTEKVDIKSAFDTVIETLQEKINRKNIEITITGQGFGIISYGHLIELVTNLVDNAIKYNKDHGAISIHIAEEMDYVSFTITDTGIGIAKEEYDRIFERFYRVDKGRNSKVEGTGLGLSIVKHILALYQGQVTLLSTLDAGTAVTVTLPK